MSHLAHLNGFSSLWVISCLFKVSCLEKLLSHIVHWYGVSPVWVLSCFFKVSGLEKLLKHFMHKYAFIEWVTSCLFKPLGCANLFSHWLHWKGFSPVWVASCLFNPSCLEKILPHFLHFNGFFSSCSRVVVSRLVKGIFNGRILESGLLFSPMWTFSWSHKILAAEKLLSHVLHLNGFSPLRRNISSLFKRLA